MVGFIIGMVMISITLVLMLGYAFYGVVIRRTR
jgi:hypothetical protein